MNKAFISIFGGFIVLFGVVLYGYSQALSSDMIPFSPGQKLLFTLKWGWVQENHHDVQGERP